MDSITSAGGSETVTTFAGILGATITILITTLDDCVWLVPYLAPSSVRIQHAATFACTLIGLTSVTVAITNIFQQKLYLLSFINNEDTFTTVIETFGAVLCWILAGYYFYKSWRKRQRRRLKQKEQNRFKDEETNSLAPLNVQSDSNGTNHDNIKEPKKETNYGACNSDENTTTSVLLVDPLPTTTTAASIVVTASRGNDDDTNNVGYNNNNTIDHPSFQPLTIVTLTISGALDEISYFPSLLLGHIFTGTELIVGTFITVLIMLCIVTQFLQRCQPLLQCLDQIPLHGIISLYAILLTVNLIIDLNSSS